VIVPVPGKALARSDGRGAEPPGTVDRMDEEEKKEIRRRFADSVTMSPAELESWLQTPESKEVGVGDGESVGHRSGRRIVELKRTKVGDLTDDDHEHMRKVAGYVARHLKQGGPAHDVEHSRWRYSLMNWGHDPSRGAR
jgi:hypothetical protein